MKMIFFDNDGTLVDTEGIYFKATRKVLLELGVEMSKKWFIEYSLKRNFSSWSLLDGKGYSPEEINQLRNKRNDYYAELLREEVRLMPGVLETLKALKGKARMSVVTTSRRIHFNIILEKTGIADYFEFFVVNEDVEKEKPHPEPYLKAIKISGCAPDDCMAVEDTERGVIAAKAAGIKCYAVPTALSQSHDFSDADGVLGSISELLEII